MGRSRSARRSPETAGITGVTHDGHGIADVTGKKVFVAGALAGETVRFQRRKKRKNFDSAELLEVLEPSSERIEPHCEAYSRCGGCSLQHVSPEAQREIKHQSLVDSLQRIGKVEPERWLPPLYEDESWHYRRRGRLAVKDVPGKGRVLVGFRERHAPFIADMHRCEVLGQPIAGMLDELSRLVGALSIRARLPQIEVAIADNATELVFRVLDEPTSTDLETLTAFAKRHDLRVALQTGGLDSITPLWPPEPLPLLNYELPAFDLRLEFSASDFVQVNAAVNRRMVSRAVELLELDSSHAVLDLYCGIGNFSLALARHAGSVVGVEGLVPQVERARSNAAQNELTNASFHCADLATFSGEESWVGQGYDRLVLDPARSGALEVVQNVERIGASRILYVSCHPGTLARDSAVLVSEQGYRLTAAGIIDMFPHTAHVESIALFDKNI